MNLTVFGATGGVGREVLTQALDAGHHVTVYVRNPDKLTVAHPNLTVITGELTDREAVQRAVGGADAVISALEVSVAAARLLLEPQPDAAVALLSRARVLAGERSSGASAADRRLGTTRLKGGAGVACASGR